MWLHLFAYRVLQTLGLHLIIASYQRVETAEDQETETQSGRNRKKCPLKKSLERNTENTC